MKFVFKNWVISAALAVLVSSYSGSSMAAGVGSNLLFTFNTASCNAYVKNGASAVSCIDYPTTGAGHDAKFYCWYLRTESQDAILAANEQSCEEQNGAQGYTFNVESDSGILKTQCDPTATVKTQNGSKSITCNYNAIAGAGN